MLYLVFSGKENQFADVTGGFRLILGYLYCQRLYASGNLVMASGMEFRYIQRVEGELRYLENILEMWSPAHPRGWYHCLK